MARMKYVHDTAKSKRHRKSWERPRFVWGRRLASKEDYVDCPDDVDTARLGTGDTDTDTDTDAEVEAEADWAAAAYAARKRALRRHVHVKK